MYFENNEHDKGRYITDSELEELHTLYDEEGEILYDGNYAVITSGNYIMLASKKEEKDNGREI